MKLATKISVTLAGVLSLAVLSSGAMLFSTRELGSLLENMVVENLASVRAAEELEIALLEQRGFVAAHILDQGNPVWLEELAIREPGFAHWLVQAQETATNPEEREILAELENVYQRYDAARDEVIGLYDRGQVEKAREKLLQAMTASYDQAYALCERLISANERTIASRLADGRRQARNNLFMVAGYASLTTTFSLVLFWFFFNGIFRPLRQMARDAHAFTGDIFSLTADEPPQDELRTVGLYLRQLMLDVSETRSNLERSRDRLLNAEKLASVGKLAASVAHEIRNPLTSLKMRLFSLRRELGDNPQFADDLRVVSEEISRLDSIIRNFLEFSRPPELKLQLHPVSQLLDKTLELCGPRLVEKDIRLVRDDAPDLPQVVVDGEQIKQVFINLLLNAAEAVEEGGRIEISTALEADRDGQRLVLIRFQDNGPGILAEVRENIFEPFFSTKETGTGLGLCIAARIMARHAGRLELEPSTGPGTCFAVRLPAEQRG